jgi:hypothetical protein
VSPINEQCLKRKSSDICWYWRLNTDKLKILFPSIFPFVHHVYWRASILDVMLLRPAEVSERLSCHQCFWLGTIGSKRNVSPLKYLLNFRCDKKNLLWK